MKRLTPIFCLLALLWTWAIPARAQDSLTFKTLLVVKPIGDIHSARHLPVRYEMTPEDIEAITVAFRDYLPRWIERMTNGRVRWQAEVKVSPHTLRTIRVWDDTCAVTPEDISDDIDDLVPQGKYDAVFVYWKSWDEITNYRLPGPYGLAQNTPEAANYAGFASVQYDVPGAWTENSGSTECFIHEWLHLLEGFYGGRQGVRLPRGGLHAGEEHGYKLNERNWKDWYAADLNAQIEEDGAKVGLGEAAWKYGLMREDAAKKPAPRPRNAPEDASDQKKAADELRESPGFLTPARRAKNLLQNSDFSQGDDGSWKIVSWINNMDGATLVPDVPKPGENSLRLTATTPDDIKIVQKVSVKKRTSYFLSGWISTRGVKIVQQNGQLGVSIGLLSGAEHSHSLVGDQKWVYVSTGFYSGERTEVEICARLGGIASTSIGSVLFRDLCLIEAND